ncbi:unnamed protein product [Phaedon cochleariae]|uniref:3-hydroxyisobutyryl-CoA hydrolase, mitochondrial n=1 Tax=Phaedon cochleariae TaxID=80249 RepID=A0A9P0GX13_PHACE|nr:unnamed protein product [Phaedon cochleariae]
MLPIIRRNVYWAMSQTPKHLSSRKLCSTESPPIITNESSNDKAVITLNRPHVHNCINATLACGLYEALKKFEKKSLLIIKGAGQAFSSGGDLKWIFQSRNAEGFKMFTYHNACILKIATYPTPCIALMDGFTFGGGVGLSRFCKYRVATERTRLGMPETLIGFHPNSAASYFFTRMEGRLGWYLALTGETLEGSDVVRAGFATHYCRSDRLENLERDLLNSPSSEESEVENILSEYSENLPEFSLRDELEKIEECFSASSMEEVFTKLEQTGSKKTLELLKQLSPTALKVTFRQLEKSGNMSLKQCLNMEYSLTASFLLFHDFPEGIRTKFIDKGKKPRWAYSTLTEVPEDVVNKHFETRPGEENQRKLLEPMGDLL